MKKSNYIIDYTSEKGKYYLFHTRHGSVVSVDVQQKERLLQLLQAPDYGRQTKAHQTLQNFGFLIPNATNEFQQVYGRQILKNFCQNNYLELTILPTEQCNFRCVYCYENFQKPAMTEFVQDAIVRFVRRELANHKGLSVSWFGGEPLLAMGVIERLSEQFMNICRQMKKPYLSSMTTNGYLLNLETFQRLQKLRVNHFQITIDGNRETHDKQRVLPGGLPTYDQIMANLRDIRDHGKGNLWTISLRTNVTKKIIENIDIFKEDILIPFGKDRRFNIMLRQMWTNFTPEAEALLCTDEEFEAFIERCQVDQESLYQEYMFAHDLNFTCYAANPNSLIWGADGLIYKCTYALYDPKNCVGLIQENGSVWIDEEKLCYWIAPRAGKTTECIECPHYGACASRCCPYKQDRLCEMGTLGMLKYYIPQFFHLAKQSADLTEEL